MAEFMEVIETIRAEEASVKELFDGEGTPAKTAKSRLAHKVGDIEYARRLAEAAEFVGEVLQGRRPTHHLREALSTADFPTLFADILDRQLLAGYRETPTTYASWCKTKTVPDFRNVKRFYTDGGDGTLDAVGEYGEYPEVQRTEGVYQYAVAKYGNAFQISWETLINDDLDALKDQPARFGRAARRSEEKFATGLICDSTGPDSTFFSVGNANLQGAASALSIDTLQSGVDLFTAQTDTEGEPIMNGPSILMVPPALEVTANNILNALQIELNDDGGTTNKKLIARNWMSGKLRILVNYYLPIVNTTNGNTAWYLFAEPNEGRGAVEFGKLRGHEEPEVFMKAPDAQRVGGGSNAMDGDFYHDAILYKVRHVFGGVVLDPKYAVASTGAAS